RQVAHHLKKRPQDHQTLPAVHDLASTRVCSRGKSHRPEHVRPRFHLPLWEQTLGTRAHPRPNLFDLLREHAKVGTRLREQNVSAAVTEKLCRAEGTRVHRVSPCHVLRAGRKGFGRSGTSPSLSVICPEEKGEERT